LDIIIPHDRKSKNKKSVGKELLRATHLASTRDENLLGVGVRGERGMHQGLVVHVLVHLRGLHQAVGDEQGTERYGLHHLHGLELGLAAMQNLLNLKAAAAGGRGKAERWAGELRGDTE
jgi:hypothetical protein|tara:strand:- start:5379 stop:5735 length:357 start_codon:yes stop_codon:yes gene_type:complete